MTRDVFVDSEQLVADLVEAGHDVDLVRECLGYARSATQLERPDLLTSYACWRADVDRSRPTSADVGRLLADLSGRAERIAPTHRERWQHCVESALAAQDGAASNPDEASMATSVHAQLCERYLSLLLEGDRKQAVRVILESVDDGLDIESLYLDVFQPVLAEVGHRWETGRLSVGKEHYCTAVTQSIIAQLGSRIFSDSPREHTLVAASVMGNLHEVGVRMISDLFELAGWDTFYLGADTPDEAVAEIVGSQRADVLAISVMLTSQLSAAARTIEVVRDRAARPGLKIMLGGRAFAGREELALRVGADLPAVAAPDCVKTADALVRAA